MTARLETSARLSKLAQWESASSLRSVRVSELPDLAGGGGGGEGSASICRSRAS